MRKRISKLESQCSVEIYRSLIVVTTGDILLGVYLNSQIICLSNLKCFLLELGHFKFFTWF